MTTIANIWNVRAGALSMVLTALVLLRPGNPAQATILDPTFDPGTATGGALVETVLLQPDGKILICGPFTSFNGTDKAYVARLNPDGSVDSSFTAHADYWVRHMALQPDGKIVIGGFFKSVEGESRNLIARLNPDGSLDRTFNPGVGAGGTLTVSITGNADPFVFAVAVQGDGKILMTGNFTTYNRQGANGIARLNADGSRDTTFRMGSGFDRWGRSFLIEANGQIMVTGWFNSYDNHSYNHILRLNPDGTADPTFNAYFGDETSVYQCVQLPDGKYVVCGHSLNPKNFPEKIRRLNADGTVDPTFHASSDEKVESLKLQSDGKLLIGGYFSVIDGVPRTGIARLNSDGSLDESLQASIDNYIWTIAFDGEGKALICGGFFHVDGVARNGVARIVTNSTGAVPPDPTPIPNPNPTPIPDPNPEPNPNPVPTPEPAPTPSQSITTSFRSDHSFAINIPTAPGVNYTLLYKDSLTDPIWLRFSYFQGDGSTKTVVDHFAPGPHRFYRITHN